MKKIKFGNHNALKITSSKTINIVKKSIKDIGTFHLTGKYYNFLNKRNINCIKPDQFLFTVNTYGKKHVLYLTKIGSKQYCIFISKKSEVMIVSQFRFHQDLFMGTLFDGELIKNNDGEWIYLITDIVYCKGVNIITKPFKERKAILEDIYENMFQNDPKLSICKIELKEYFEYKYLKSVCEEYIPKKNIKCSGLLFKNLNNFSDNFLYIFLECRSDNKIMNNNQKNKITIGITKKKTSTASTTSAEKSVMNVNRDYVVLLLKNTPNPDVYELHCKGSNGQVEMHSFACVPNIKKSKYLRKILKNKSANENDSDMSSESDFSEDEEDLELKMKCVYHKNFKKWIPKCKTDEEIDDINLVNHFELYFDNN